MIGDDSDIHKVRNCLMSMNVPTQGISDINNVAPFVWLIWNSLYSLFQKKKKKKQ